MVNVAGELVVESVESKTKHIGRQRRATDDHGGKSQHSMRTMSKEVLLVGVDGLIENYRAMGDS